MPNKSQRPCYLKHFSAEQSGWNAAAHFGFDLLWHWPWKMHLARVLNIPEAAKDMVGLLWKLCQNKFAIGAIGNAEHSRECPNEDDRRPQYNKSNSYAGKHTFGNISYMCTTRDKYFCFAFSLSINRVITGQGFHISKVALMLLLCERVKGRPISFDAPYIWALPK